MTELLDCIVDGEGGELAALEDTLVALFDREPLQAQPRAIAEIGCVDGRLLRRLYTVVATRSLRGRHLARHPLQAIGVCASDEGMGRARQALEGLPHMLVKGDCEHPQGLMPELHRGYITDPEGILYIGAFRQRRNLATQDGNHPESAASVQRLIDQLTRWRVLAPRHGLLLLQSQGQMVVGGDVFKTSTCLMAAAQAGLFPHAQPFPHGTLYHLQPCRYRIRHPLAKDLPTLRALELACWPCGLGATEQVLQRRMDIHPQGQVVMEFEGQVVAAVYSQRLASSESLRHTSSAQVEALHEPDGPVAQLLGICVNPERKGEGLADELIDFMLTYLATVDGVRTLVGVTRCHHYDGRRPDALAMHDYIRQRDARSGRLLEPMLCFHESHGAVVREVLEGYRPLDEANRGAGVLIEYPDLRVVTPIDKRPAVQAGSTPWEAVVRELLVGVLGEHRFLGYGEQVPLMEMGLTSLQMLELRHRLAERLGSPLEATFFFQHGTPRAIIDHLEGRFTALEHPPASDAGASADGIAIVGVGCRFPGGVSSPEHFWSLLEAGGDAVGPRDGSDQPSGAAAVGGFIDAPFAFDARFFRISPREAQLLDPRQRLLLETTWASLEQGGIVPSALRGSNTGVFIGLMGHGHDVLLRGADAKHATQPGFTTGNAASIAAGRLAYFFDWHGPVLAVDTACSSSLVAIHMACESLRAGSCDLALAGGANLLLDEAETEAFRGAGMLSPRGRCSTFDGAADGYVRGEGCGMLMLKRWADAQADGDPVWAVIRGSAINHDGAGAGLTVPNQAAQRAVIEAALRQARLTPDQVQYLEAHGTGTRLGDPIEVQAAAQALGAGRRADRPLLLGSVKTNLGHLEAAAGVAGLIKVLLAMRKGRIPRQLHFDSPNPELDWARLPVRVVAQAQAWFDGRRIAGVSSFGFSGTNAHVVVEACESASTSRPATAGAPVLIVLSARTRQSLEASADRLRTALEAGRFVDADLPDIAYTLQAGREAMAVRLALVAHSVAELAGKLAAPGLLKPGHPGTWHGEFARDAGRESRHEISGVDTAKDLDALARRWVRGEAVHWARLYGTRSPRRVDLPTYPFERQVCSVLHGITTGSHDMDRQPVPVQPEGAQGEGKPRKLQLRALDNEALPEATQTLAASAGDGAASAELRSALERELTESLAAALYLSPSEIDVEHLFVDLGLDSVIGVEWVREINRRYGLSLTAPVVYEHSTVRRMAAFVGQMRGDTGSEPAKFAQQTPADIPAEPAPQTAPTPRTVEPVPTGEKIAIIGMSGRYPGAPTLEEHWDNLVRGVDCVEEIPASRWSVQDWFDPDAGKADKTYSKWLGRLDDIDCFDPLFFNMSPAEAEWVDPQQRLFLEEGYKAFEDAGYPPRQLSDARCGVYLGIMGPSEYAWLAQQQRGAAEITGRSEAIAAARLAYFLNLKGPAILVDTACSSSLVATHLACQALRSGEVDVALVGGATLYLTPQMYTSMCKAGMLSPTGKCRALDNAADGIVPGEGVGALVLKRLADAERDGDRIHGVIVASGINQDGKTNGITAPSAGSQVALEREVYARYQVHPESISYVELHGTGTKLGDPIELSALDTVFREQTEKRNFCGLGSVKSNIGHTTATAGVAGVHKVLLQMKHRQLVPTLHFATPNEHFDFARSPFFVSTTNTPWQAPEGQPLRAAVSAFGISGTNAHVVIDAYQADMAATQADVGEPVLVVLSAQRADRLKAHAERLRQFIDTRGPVDLAAFAYTLQTGRAAFEHRLAFVATSLAQVRAALDDFVNGKATALLLTGQARPGADAVSVLAGEAAFEQLLASLLAQRRLSKLAELWVRGIEIDWARLHAGRLPERLSLPAYPFAQERYWVAPTDCGAGRDPATALHPLLGRNSSTLREQRFSTVLTGREWYVRDHVIAGQPLVPGVVQLEWARAAVALASELAVDHPMVLEEVAWLRPLVVDGPLEVHVGLSEAQEGGVRFELYSGADGDTRVYSQGWARPKGAGAAPRIDLAEVRAACAELTPGEACHERFVALGLVYGQSLRALTEVRCGPAVAVGEIVASVPAEGFTLPPSLLDGALQASIVLSGTRELRLPFAVRKVEQWACVANPAWAVVRHAEGDAVDVDLVDGDGQVAVRLSGFSCRAPAPGEGLQTLDEPTPLLGALSLAPSWEAVSVSQPVSEPRFIEVPSSICQGADCQAWLSTQGPVEHLLWQVPTGLKGVAGLGLQLVQALLALDYGTRALNLTVVTRQAIPVRPGEAGDPEQASVHGLVGALAKEYGHWQVRLLDLSSEAEWPLRDGLPGLPEQPGETLAEREGVWRRQRLVPCTLPTSQQGAFRQQGVYVILGGAGGIGIAFTEYLVQRYQAQVVWLGRREADEAIEGQRARLGQLGPTPLYLRADATDRGALETARQAILARYGTVHGVVHGAIVLEDRGVAQMIASAFDASFQAKATTSEHLEAVFGRDPLDFLLFFSSIQSFIRAPGQSNYAAGCCFADTFALQPRPRPYPVKVLNWGYWGSVGVVASDAYRRRMADIGIGSIEPPEAMAVVERLLASPLQRLAYLRTTHAQAAQAWGVTPDREQRVALPVPSVALAGVDPTPPPEQTQALLADFEQCLAKVLRGLLAQPGGVAARYVGWREDSLRLLEGQGDSSPVTDWARQWEDDRERLLQGAGRALLGARIHLLDAVLPVLGDVLRGERAATDVLFPDGGVGRVEAIYRADPLADYYNDVLGAQLVAYVTQRLAQDPQARLRIIEVGAGTGGTSARLFERLAPYAASLAEYRYTDVSEAFLLHAQAHFAGSVPYLQTGRLDIERAPQCQGIEPGHFDVVVAANVLHATRDIHRTLRHVKGLLRGNGLLLLNELTQASLFTHLTFGLLDGWRAATDGALRVPGTPALEPRTWQQVLRHEGYLSVGLPAEAAHGLGQQILTAFSDGVIEVVRDAQAQPASVRSDNRPPRLGQSHASEPIPGGTLSSRQAIHEAFFEVLKLDRAQLQDDQAFANYGVDSITGITLTSTINRKTGLRLPVTALFDHPSIRSLAEYLDGLRPAVAEQPRVEPVTPVEASLPRGVADSTRAEQGRRSRTAPPAPPQVPSSSLPAVESVQVCRHLWIEGPGHIDELHIVESPLRPMGADEVRIAVRAFALNFGDLLCVSGLYPTQPAYPFTPGFEASGVVLEVGANVSRVAVGDAVYVLGSDTLGAHASVVTCSETRVFPLPQGLSFEEGCALPVVALTVIASFARAQVKPGERVLIQTATGGTGLIAVQMAQHAGAQIYATAGSQEKLDYLAGLGVAHRINYREEDFEAAVMRLTEGRGVDVVINTLAGDAIQKGLNCLAPGGRYVELAMTALKSARTIDLSKLHDNQVFISVDLRKQERNNPAATQALAREMADLFAAGAIRPTLSKVFDFEQVRDAYAWLADRRNIGKVVVRVAQAAPTPALQPVAVDSDLPEPIAVIGMSGRFASADSLDELWQVLEQGQDLFEEVTRWDLASHFPAYTPYCRRGGFLRDVDSFDPLFFNISGREAKVMDPQQRLFLEEAWRALEDAGYAGASGEGLRCGVYVGCAAGDYLRLLGSDAPAQAFWGNAGSVIPARIAYHLDLQGPAVATDTACSSSLVALHQACQGLRAGDADLAIAGGVFVQSTELFHLQAQQAGMLSATGVCHAFDARADGFVPGEGVGALVLKRLSQAVADGDAIHGVIRGTGINQDGATNGITAPNASAQARLEREVYRRHGIDVRHIGLVEAHGTGTVLGDPIEFRALCEAFAQGGPRAERCALGSIKSTVGHTATAAGIAGVIKVLLALRHRRIPASAHFVSANPHIDLAASPFHVPSKPQAWARPAGGERLAAVSAFGFSGTNAHAVIGEAPERGVRVSTRPAYLVVLSARSAQQLRRQVENLLAHLAREPVELGAMSHTLLVGRRHFEHRLGFVAGSVEALRAQLSGWLEDGQLITGGSGTVQPAEALVAHGRHCLHQARAVCDPQALEALLATLVQCYVQGVELDWGQLFEGERPGRIGLPTYPFEKERYWVTRETPGAQERPQAPLQPRDEPVDAPAQAKPDGLKLRALEEGAWPPAEVVAPVLKQPVRLMALAETPLVEDTPLVLPGAIDPPSVAVPGRDCTNLERELTDSLARMLGIDTGVIQPDTPFASLGMDSIIAVEWTRDISKRYGLSIGATAVYRHPTLARMVQCVAQAQGASPANVAPRIDEPEESEASQAQRETEPAADTKPLLEGIAVIGMSGRYPGADSLDTYWHNLVAGRDCVEEIPASRWDVSAYFDADAREPGKIYSKWLGRLDDIDCFDPLFFKIAPLEAELMDPQQRLFLEEGYKAFEDAGYGPRLLGESRCGVYLGMLGGNEYAEQVQRCQGVGDITGSNPAVAAARLAYFLNLKGPALMVDTACSSSLVATHLACQALRSGEIDMALAGGVTLYLAPQAYQAMCHARVLSPQGRCRPLDNEADGFVPGEGVGALVLKRLSDAIRDGDPIHGVIAGSGINQDGKTNGMTAPSAAGQEELVRAVYARHGIDPTSIGYIELHGTGTKLGDPIEMEALSAVFRPGADGRQGCGLGSVKSNIGHTSAAAGVAGLHKVLLQMKHRALVPTLHYRTPNEHVDLEGSPFFVCDAYQPWQAPPGQGLRAAVSSFGISGTNAHLVVDEYRAPRRTPSAAGQGTRPVLIVLGAKREAQLKACAERLKAHVEREASADLEAIAYTLQVGRAELAHRLAFVAESRAQLLEHLQAFIDGQADAQVHSAKATKVADERREEATTLLAGPVSGAMLARLGALWVMGGDIDWRRLYPGTPPNRVSLPSYPFARESYWVQESACQPPQAPGAAP